MTDKNRPFAQAPVSRFWQNVTGAYGVKPPITRFIVILENNQLRFGQ
jgi:hypothetical protein